MKKMFLFSLLALLSLEAVAQASPKKTAENDVLKVSYSAPSKKGREVYGSLVPFGQVWRTGANEATEITFKKDVTVGGKSVKAGTYSLFTIPAEKEWSIILNSELKQWGSYGYDKIKDKNVVEVKANSMALTDLQELFTINATAAGFDIIWDKTKVSVPVK